MPFIGTVVLFIDRNLTQIYEEIIKIEHGFLFNLFANLNKILTLAFYSLADMYPFELKMSGDDHYDQ